MNDAIISLGVNNEQSRSLLNVCGLTNLPL